MNQQDTDRRFEKLEHQQELLENKVEADMKVLQTDRREAKAEVDDDNYVYQLNAITEEYRWRCCKQIEDGTMNNVFGMIDIAFRLTCKKIQNEQVSGTDWQKKETAYKQAVEDINTCFRRAKILLSTYQESDNAH